MDFGVDIIYIINLPTYPERKNRIIKLFKEYSITNYEFIEAISGSELKGQKQLIKEGTLNSIFIDCNGLLTKNIIGCALSHQLAYKTFLATKHETCLILEDDVLFSDKMYTYKITGRLDRFISQVKRVDYDIVIWGRMHEPIIGKNPTEHSEIFNPNLLSDKYSAHAYQLNRKSAKIISDKVKPIRYAADVLLETLDLNIISPEDSLFIQKRGIINEDHMERMHLALWHANSSAEWHGSTAEEVRKEQDSPYDIQNANVATSFSVNKVVFNYFKSYLSVKPVKWAYIHLEV